VEGFLCFLANFSGVREEVGVHVVVDSRHEAYLLLARDAAA